MAQDGKRKDIFPYIALEAVTEGWLNGNTVTKFVSRQQGNKRHRRGGVTFSNLIERTFFCVNVKARKMCIRYSKIIQAMTSPLPVHSVVYGSESVKCIRR